MSEGFSSHGGRLEIEYNKAFQRILAGAKDSKDNSSGIPIGQAESLHVFCESRLSDAKSMMNSEPARFTKSMVDQLAENFGVLAR